MTVPRGFTLHQFLIDPDGRGWCGDDCVGDDGPHWKGESPEQHWGRA